MCKEHDVECMNYHVDIISYPLFASADRGIYPHLASQYHARPKAKRGIAMLSVDKFPYPQKQKVKRIYPMLKRCLSNSDFCSFNISDTPYLA